MVSQNLIPHGYCLSWNPQLLWTFVVSDSVIAVSYFSIPFAIWYFAKKRPDISHNWLFSMFGIFIIACGITHLLDVVNIWKPIYWPNAISRIITAIVSLITAAIVWRIMPDALAAPSAQQLKEVNLELEKTRLELESRVISRTQELSEALAQAQRFSNALDHISPLVYMKNLNDQYVYANKPTLQLFKCSMEELRNTDDTKYFPEKIAKRLKSTDSKVLEHRVETAEEVDFITDDGKRHTYWEIKAPIYEDADKTKIWGICGISTEITERKAAADEIQHLAFHDLLTQLPNRQLLMDRLRRALASSVRLKQIGALLFLDLDHFKTLNDTLGHDFGDLLLQEVANRLVKCVRESDTVARLGGDEFVIMLEEIGITELEAAKHAETIGDKILFALNEPYQLHDIKYRITTSIGITLFGVNEQSQDDVLKHADIAMYQAKKAGRNAMRFFDPLMQEAINSRAEMERDLQQAINQNEFQLYYQVQVDSDGVAFGAEALIRWVHPQKGMVSPANFIPLAEESGLILPIGNWVLERACLQLKEWESNPLTSNLSLSINISAKQFNQPDFVVQVQTAVQGHAINPTLLKLELTESMLADDIDHSIITMVALEALGIRFELDDFGTGYSSLQYLKQLPLYQLKIDQSFIHDIVNDSSDQAIVRTIIAMALSLNIAVIAEGVETSEQQEFLLNNGCSRFQGYLFSKPMPIGDFEALLEKN